MALLSFKGKTFVQNYHLAVKYHQLIPKKDKSLTDKVSLKDNLNNTDLIEKHGLKEIEYCQLPFEIYKLRG